MTHTNAWYLELSGKVAQGIGVRTQPKIQEFLESTENLEGQDIALVQIGYAFAPDYLTPDSFIERGPYTNPNNYKDQMEASAKRGWLEKVTEGQYKLSEKGKQLAENFFGSWNDWFGTLPTLPEAETHRTAELLANLVKAAYQNPELSKKPTMEIGMRLKPDKDAPAMLRVRRYITDLAYYRDDVHIAAWKPYGTDGIVWETLTFLWNGDAATGAELAEKISDYRNYDANQYTAAFDQLVALGWASAENSKYKITDEGKKIRQEAEDATDQLFYAPFRKLDQGEIKELKKLLEKLAKAVAPPEEAADSE